MVKKLKGIRVNKDLLEKFKFDREGRSKFGSAEDDTHSLLGSTGAADVDLTGPLALNQRISEALFGLPQMDGLTNTTELQELADNATEFEGFMIYLTNASTVAPFVDNEKFYFCEDGEWHPSPFTAELSDADGDGVPDTEDPFTVETSNTGEVSVVFMTNNTTNLQNDPIFEADASGDVMIDASPSGTNGNFEIDDQGDVMPASS